MIPINETMVSSERSCWGRALDDPYFRDAAAHAALIHAEVEGDEAKLAEVPGPTRGGLEQVCPFSALIDGE